MSLSTPCPSCGQPVTLSRFITALTPWHVRCRACRARVPIPLGSPAAVILSIAAAGALAFGLAHLLVGLHVPLGAVAAVVVGLAVALDVGVCAICIAMCNRRAGRGGSGS